MVKATAITVPREFSMLPSENFQNSSLSELLRRPPDESHIANTCSKSTLKMVEQSLNLFIVNKKDTKIKISQY